MGLFCLIPRRSRGIKQFNPEGGGVKLYSHFHKMVIADKSLVCMIHKSYVINTVRNKHVSGSNKQSNIRKISVK